MERSSHISGFYNLSPTERQRAVAEWAAIPPEQSALMENSLTLDRADKMVENVVGTVALPMGVATNFVGQWRDVLVPMVIEEPSVVAGASFAAKLAQAADRFRAETTETTDDRSDPGARSGIWRARRRPCWPRRTAD
jgi:hydroxymethylglutaryl-CoA reductase